MNKRKKMKELSEEIGKKENASIFKNKSKELCQLLVINLENTHKQDDHKKNCMVSSHTTFCFFDKSSLNSFVKKK